MPNNVVQTQMESKKDGLLFFVTTTVFLVLTHGPVNQIVREKFFKENLMFCMLIETRLLTCRRVL